MKKRLLSWLLVLTMITSLIPSTLITSALAAALPSQYAAVYDAADLDPATSFEDGKTYRLTGTGSVPVKIGTGKTVTIVLDGVTINSTTSPIQVETGAKLTLIPRNNTVNTLTCTSDTAQAVTDNSAGGLTAGISVPEGAELVIDKDDAGDGTLTVTGGYGGAGIGGSYTHDLLATTAAKGNDGVTGPIGFGAFGEANQGGAGGTYGEGGLGGRYGSNGTNAGTIKINGGILNATGGVDAAGIGGGRGRDGDIGKTGGNGNQGTSGSVTCPSYQSGRASGGGGGGGAGAGGNGGNGGAGGNGGTVTITGGTVTAIGSNSAAGIGGGAGGTGGAGGAGGTGGAGGATVTGKPFWSDLTMYTAQGGSGGNGAGGLGGRGGTGGAGGTLSVSGGKIHSTGHSGFGGGKVGDDGLTGTGTRTNGQDNGTDGKTIYTGPQPSWQTLQGNYWWWSGNNANAYAGVRVTGGNGGDVGGQQSVKNDNGAAGTLTITGSSANVDFTSTGGGDLTNGRPTDKNGDALYRVELTVYNLEKDATIKDANVNVTIPASSGKASYTYKTVSENNGKAVLWLPAGTYNLEQKAVNHATLGEIPKDVPVTLKVAENDSNKQDVMIGVVVKVTADRTDKVYFAQDSENPVNIQVDTSEVNQTIASVKWFRETIKDHDDTEYAPTNTGNKEVFDKRYGQITEDSGDKGTLTNPTGGVYSLPTNQNGRYWVQIEYTSNGVPVKLVKGLVVSNIYREYPIQVRSYIYEGVDSLGQPILRQDTGYTNPPDKAGAPTAQTCGFAWDLNGYDEQNPNGANLLSGDVAPYDTLILNAKTANHTWYVAEVNGNQFADTASKKDFEPIKLTLDGNFFQNQYCDSKNSVKDPGKYTIRYSARDGALDVVTISGVIKDAASGTKPLYTHTRSYTDAIDNDSITAINWPEYKLVGVQVNDADKTLDKDVDGKTTSSITITDIHGKDSGKENKIQTVTFLYQYNMTDVTINAYYEDTTTPVEGLSSYKEKREIDKEYTPTAPAVAGHDLAGSSLQDGKFTPTGTNDVITFYYTKSSGNVTYKAVDGEGNTLWTGSGKVTKGDVPTDVTPDYGITNMTKDGAVATKYTKTADGTDYGNDNKYDGVNDMTVTYTYKAHYPQCDRAEDRHHQVGQRRGDRNRNRKTLQCGQLSDHRTGQHTCWL